ncbi:unnamed protein product [Polarella glacialis]|uniref:Kinesin motor domain-containing protein n=1 Tax=Polarella glacialis TaxID=89957 RepID=A0A813H711_POLGL|nr:unnamed protein product [Polarella glacialis]
MLVDCAGTERKKTDQECIRLLTMQQRVPSHAFRASSLTKLLADAFTKGARAKLAVVCTASPCATDTEHTISTLRMGMGLGGKGSEQEGAHGPKMLTLLFVWITLDVPMLGLVVTWPVALPIAGAAEPYSQPIADDGESDEDLGPTLVEFAVTGELPSAETRPAAFQPPFERRHRNYKCYLDFAMTNFGLSVQPEPGAVLSRLTRDGAPVASRLDLKSIHLAAGQETVFSMRLSGGDTNVTSSYTLVVARRSGSSTALRTLQSTSAKLDEPFHPGELKGLFHAVQSRYEDILDVACTKADGDQSVSCAVESGETMGDMAPTFGEMAFHPKTYVPSVEKLTPPVEEEHFNPHSGWMVRCKVPIDTWRRVTLKFDIISADKTANRQVRVVVTRDGCPHDQFYYDARCMSYCPMFYYEQKFNWRCGRCNENCEFCKNWGGCEDCRRDTTLQRYELRDDGTCEAFRIHPFKVYYDCAKLLAGSCAALISLYVLGCAAWLTHQACSERPRGKAGSIAYSEEEREPLTSRP